MAANRHWTEEEVEHLRWHWTYRSIKKLSSDLDRTPIAITQKARELKLGPPSKRGMSLRAFARYTGFSYNKVLQAAKKFEIRMGKAYSGDAGRGNVGKTNQYALDIDTQEQLLEVMLEHERIYSDSKENKRTTRGKWGVGKKPNACVDCGSSKKPHYAKGKCASCYNKKYAETKARAKMWGVDGKPDECIRCGRSDVKHYARNMCSACYKKRRKNG